MTVFQQERSNTIMAQRFNHASSIMHHASSIRATKGVCVYVSCQCVCVCACVHVSVFVVMEVGAHSFEILFFAFS